MIVLNCTLAPNNSASPSEVAHPSTSPAAFIAAHVASASPGASTAGKPNARSVRAATSPSRPKTPPPHPVAPIPCRCFMRASFSGGGTPSMTPIGMHPCRSQFAARSNTTFATCPSGVNSSAVAGCDVAWKIHSAKSTASTLPSTRSRIDGCAFSSDASDASMTSTTPWSFRSDL